MSQAFVFYCNLVVGPLQYPEDVVCEILLLQEADVKVYYLYWRKSPQVPCTRYFVPLRILPKLCLLSTNMSEQCEHPHLSV